MGWLSAPRASLRMTLAAQVCVYGEGSMIREVGEAAKMLMEKGQRMNGGDKTR